MNFFAGRCDSHQFADQWVSGRVIKPGVLSADFTFVKNNFGGSQRHARKPEVCYHGRKFRMSTVQSADYASLISPGKQQLERGLATGRSQSKTVPRTRKRDSRPSCPF